MIEIEGSGNVCENMEDALGVLNRMKDPTVKVVVYDTETNGLDHRNGYIVGHVITLGPGWQQNFYVPVRHGEPKEGNILEEFQDKVFGHPFEAELNEIWNARRDLLIVGHNLQFDLRFLFRHNITTKSKLEDTQVNAALLNEHLGRFSLDSIARLMGAREKRGEPLYRYLASKFGCEADRNSMAHFWKLSGRDRQGCDYALGDGLSTWDVWEAQQSALASQDLTDIHALEKRVTRAVYRMYMRGVRVDRGRMDEVSSIVQTLLDEARKALPDDFNPRSSTQMRKLMEANGHTDWPLTEKGNPQFNEAFLKKYPIGQAVIRVRKYSNLENSFITPLRERHVWEDGRVRAIYYQMASDDFGTVTGRFSCTEPNMQQVPKRNVELGKLVRSIFVPYEGHLWYSADLAQCLAGDTRVMIPGGWKEIKDIRPGDLVMSYGHDGLPKVRKVTWSGMTGIMPVYRLKWYTNGRTRGYLDATANHPIRMRDGSYKTVEELLSTPRSRKTKTPYNISVSAMRRAVQTANGYKRNYVFTNGYDRYNEARLVAEEVYGGTEGKVIHHKDGNSLNDDPSNLEIQDSKEHNSMHRVAEAAAKTPEARRSLAIKASMAAKESRSSVPFDNHVIYDIVLLDGVHPVYDITVEDTHNFIANEICVHNCEPRLLAHYSETPVLVNGYTIKPFVDCHSSVAKSANIERQDGKVLNQTLITGGGRKAIIEQLGARGGELYDRYFETMPEIKVLQKTASRRMEQRGYVRSYLGRRARLERRDKSYTAINRLLQCGNADICKEVLVRMDEYFESEGDVVGVLDTIHDAFDLSAPDDPKGAEIAMNGLRMMADYGPGRRRELVVPMAADYATGSTWAEASYPDKGSKKILGEDPDDESFKVHA